MRRVRSEAIEVGTCRSGRRGGAAGSETFEYSSHFELRRAVTSSCGGKTTALGDQESIGGDRQGRVVVEPAPSAALVVGQPELLLELFVITLDPPAQLHLPYEL